MAFALLHSNVYVSQRTNEKLRDDAVKEQMKELQKLGEVHSRHLAESSAVAVEEMQI